MNGLSMGWYGRDANRRILSWRSAHYPIPSADFRIVVIVGTITIKMSYFRMISVTGRWALRCAQDRMNIDYL